MIHPALFFKCATYRIRAPYDSRLLFDATLTRRAPDAYSVYRGSRSLRDNRFFRTLTIEQRYVIQRLDVQLENQTGSSIKLIR